MSIAHTIKRYTNVLFASLLLLTYRQKYETELLHSALRLIVQNVAILSRTFDVSKSKVVKW